jgi:hypothetical protein
MQGRVLTVAAYEGIPGGDLIEAGLADLARGKETVPSLLVLIGAPRLRALGVRVPVVGVDSPEHRLYALLSRDEPDAAHGRYNALLRRLVSFERTLECAG